MSTSDMNLSFLPLLLSRQDNQFNMFLLIIIQSIIHNIEQIKKFFILLFTSYSDKYLSFTITGKVFYKDNIVVDDDYSMKFKSIMYDLNNRLKNDKITKYKLEEINSTTRIYKDIDLKFITFKNNISYKLTDTLYISTYTINECSIKEDNKYITYYIKLESKINSFNEINEYINKCNITYNNEQIKIYKTQHIFIYDSIHKDTGKLIFQVYPFNTTKNFNNMFFKQKDEIIKRINYFNNEEETFKRLGINHTLGFLFHGKPGTGKTSCIKSIAEYTKRHVFIIPIKKITSIEILKKIFLTINVNHVDIPNDQRLYIFEEIDCSQWSDILKSRSSSHNEIEELSQKDEIMDLLIEKIYNNDENKVSKPKNIKSDITLGDFLELLDGVIEIPKRMMIFTTNHPDKLDPALLRPGRIDMVIEFKNLSKEDINNMYKLWFYKSISDDIMIDMKDYIFSQAQIGYLFSSQDIEYINNVLKTNKL